MGDATLVVTKMFNAPVEDVFDAWIDPVQVAQWYGPDGFTNEIHSFEAKEGGRYSLTMHGPDGDHILQGTFKTIEKPKKLAFTWQWKNADGNANHGGETLVTVELKEMGGKTEMTMTHSGFVDEKVRQMHEMGWTSSFGKLSKLFA